MTTPIVTDNDEQQHESPTRMMSIIMIISGIIGIIFSGIIMSEKLELAKDSTRMATCTINDVLSCTDVMNSMQSEIFGFPNPYIGFVGFTALLTLGLVIASGVKLPKWMVAALGIGMLLAALFVSFLMMSAISDIRALCIYCMVIWAVTIPAVIIVAGYIFRDHTQAERVGEFLYKFWWIITLVLYVIIFAWMYSEFGARMFA